MTYLLNSPFILWRFTKALHFVNFSSSFDSVQWSLALLLKRSAECRSIDVSRFTLITLCLYHIVLELWNVRSSHLKFDVSRSSVQQNTEYCLFFFDSLITSERISQSRQHCDSMYPGYCKRFRTKFKFFSMVQYFRVSISNRLDVSISISKSYQG